MLYDCVVKYIYTIQNCNIYIKHYKQKILLVLVTEALVVIIYEYIYIHQHMYTYTLETYIYAHVPQLTNQLLPCICAISLFHPFWFRFQDLCGI